MSSLVASGAAGGTNGAHRTAGADFTEAAAATARAGGSGGAGSPGTAQRDGYHPAGYPDDHPLVPHGMSVILNAPAVFRFTGTADPERHLEAARLMGADVRGRSGGDQAGAALADAIVDLMRAVDMPSELAAVGLTRAAEADLAALFADALRYW